MKPLNFEWQQQDKPQDDPWASSPNHNLSLAHASSTEQARPEHTLQRKFYELATAITLIYGLVGLFIWQQTDQRLVNLEQEVMLLRSQPTVTARQASDEHSLAAVVAALQQPAIKPQWHALVEMSEIHLRLSDGQELAATQQQLLAEAAATIAIYPLQRTLVPSGQEQWREELAMHAPSYRLPNPPQYAAANQLVKFLLAEYGTAKVVALVEALPDHDGWETLAPALFALSTDEFEAAWHSDLQQHARLHGKFPP